MRPFAYRASRRSPEATSTAALRAGSGAAPAYLAGGTTLLDLMKLDVMPPERLVDITAPGRRSAASSWTGDAACGSARSPA